MPQQRRATPLGPIASRGESFEPIGNAISCALFGYILESGLVSYGPSADSEAAMIISGRIMRWLVLVAVSSTHVASSRSVECGQVTSMTSPAGRCKRPHRGVQMALQQILSFFIIAFEPSPQECLALDNQPRTC